MSDIKLDDIIAAVKEDDCIGFCVACGEQSRGVEPDGAHGHCDDCGQDMVFGAEELLIQRAGI